ncbi:MAG: hypothetical protein HZB47_00765 [Nitrosomonadales bacterium]|nr:hypothetical protein [Nitrosomonadales bacterium]
MEESPNLYPRYSTDWGVRFLCDCKKQNKEIRIHQGIAREISTHGVHILSDHPICLQKKIAMQLMIPSLSVGAPQKVVKIIGHSIETINTEGKYLTEIAFTHFEENGLKELERNLRQRFGTQFSVPAAQRA